MKNIKSYSVAWRGGLRMIEIRLKIGDKIKISSNVEGGSIMYLEAKEILGITNDMNYRED